MSMDNPEAPPPGGQQRRQFLGRAAAIAVAATGVPALLGACDAGGATEPDARRAPEPGQPRQSLGGGRDPGATLHKMVAGTIGSAPDVKVPALEKGTTSTYVQRVITDTDRTGTGLATVLKSSFKFANGTTVQLIVQDSRGRVWPPRAVSKNSDLAYAMKDAMASNPLHVGVQRVSLTAGSAVISIAKSHIVQFPDSVASDIYGNHNDIAARGFCDLFRNTVGGIQIASTTRDPSRC